MTAASARRRASRAVAARAVADDSVWMEERRRQIRELVDEKGSVGTEDLAEHFHTSQVTIRADLRALAQQGRLARTHGGAVALRDTEELPFGIKAVLNLPEKVRIAAAAAALIRDGETVILDSGSTTGEIAKKIRALPLKSINVITNALNVATALAGAAHVRLVMLGGVLRPHSLALSGPQAEAALAGLQADRLFLGVDSLDPEVGLMTPHLLEAQLNTRMIRASRQVVAVADASKLARRNLSVIASVEQIDMLITDRAANAGTVSALRHRGLEVLVA